MNKKKILIIAIAVVLVLAIALTTLYIFFAPGDFRRAKWGMSMSQVKSRESAELIKEEYASLSYPITSLEGIDFNTTAFYNFNAETDELTHVSMGLSSSTFDDKKIARLVSTLEEKYGEPEKSEVSEIRYDYKWETKRTRIFIKQLYSYTLVIYEDVTIPPDAE